MSDPFLTFYTTAFRRPAQLAMNLSSVANQTVVDAVDQVVLPDHAGLGIGPSLYGRLTRWYLPYLRGRYVHLLADDDALASADAVEVVLQTVAEQDVSPDVVIVTVQKGDLLYPQVEGRSFRLGDVDIGSFIVKRTVLQRHAEALTPSYTGDYDLARALYDDPTLTILRLHENFIFAVGPASGGRPELDY